MQNCRHNFCFSTFHIDKCWLNSETLTQYDLFDGSYTEWRFSLCFKCCKCNTAWTVETRKQVWMNVICHCSTSCLLIWQLKTRVLCELGSACPLVSLISLGDYSIMVLIYIILSMGYSPLFCAAPKMKFIVTTAFNQLGYSCSTAYKIYVVLQEGHGPYAWIDYKSIVFFSRILTPGRQTPKLYVCPLLSSSIIRLWQRSLLCSYFIFI